MKTMHIGKILCAAALALAPFAASGEPFNRARIPADTKWLVHLNIEGLLNTRVGKLMARMAERETYGRIQELQSGFGQGKPVGMDNLRSITAFGSAYELNPDSVGVLVLNLDGGIKDIATGFLVQQALAGADDENAPVKEISNEEFSLYSIQDEVYLSLDEGGLAFLSKSRAEMKEARDIWSGKAPGMDAASSFGNLADLREGFFFLAVAEGFNENLPIPPQANFLKLAGSARIVMGEGAEDLYAALKLKAQTKQGALQMQQILQGVLALAPLIAAEEPALRSFISRSSLTNENGTVSLNLRYPVADAMKALEEIERKAEAKRKRQGGPDKNEENEAAP